MADGYWNRILRVDLTSWLIGGKGQGQ